jgi:hypothetical protein
MDTLPADIQRRAMLQVTAGLAAAGSMGTHAAQGTSNAPTPQTGASAPAATGKAGDFDFLMGQWQIKNRQLKQGAWDQITPMSCHWYQASSKDGGKTWFQNWGMQWRRV